MLVVCLILFTAVQGFSQEIEIWGNSKAKPPSVAISAQYASQVGQLARLGKGTVNGVTYAPDGQLLAVASSLGIYLYDAGTLAEVRFIETDRAVKSVAFSSDGTVLASGSKDGTVRLWGILP